MTTEGQSFIALSLFAPSFCSRMGMFENTNCSFYVKQRVKVLFLSSSQQAIQVLNFDDLNPLPLSFMKFLVSNLTNELQLHTPSAINVIKHTIA